MSGPLFDDAASPSTGARPPAAGTPLAERIRPKTLDEIVGQEAILAPGTPLREAIERQASEGGERALQQLQALSDIVMTKYQLIRSGLVLYGVAAVACAVAVLVS